MTTQEIFQRWADEINREWTGYTATASGSSLVVYANGNEVGRIDYDGGRYAVTSDDADVREMLEHYTNR